MSNRRAQDERIEGTPDGVNAITEIVDVPDAPTIGTATAAGQSASITFTPATTGGTASTYTAISNPGSITGTSATSPITVSGLTGGTAYTFTVRGSNSTGTGPLSSASNSITAIEVPGAYDSLGSATITSSGSIAEVSFTGIPSTYKHLQLRLSAGNNTAGIYYVAVYNDDTAQANYPRHRLFGSGTSAGASATINVDSSTRGAMIGSPLYSTTYQGVAIVDILDYANTNKNKTTSSLFGQEANGSGVVELHSSIWLSTSAITSINVRCNLSGGDAATTTYNSGSIISLYGVN